MNPRIKRCIGSWRFVKPKGSQKANWALRPLSKKQIDYALADVTHLRKVYNALCDRLADGALMTFTSPVRPLADWLSEVRAAEVKLLVVNAMSEDELEELSDEIIALGALLGADALESLSEG